MLSKTLFGVVLSTVLTAATPPVAAGGFPQRPVKLVVPFPPGGLVGTVALALGNKMTTALGQPVVVENKPGAAGTIAAAMVAKAPKDGYMILFGTSATLGSAKYTYKDLAYDPIDDFSPVAIVGNVAAGVFASQKSGIGSLDEMMAALKARPGQISYGSPGVGSVSHLAAELFKLRAGVDMLHVPYAGTVPQMSDLVGGQTQLAITGVASGMNYTKDGRVKLVAIAAKERSASQPQVPALGELIPGYDAPAWLGVVAPRGTPQPVLDRLEKAAQAALADPEMKALLQGQGIDLLPMTAREFGDKMRHEMPLWAEAVKASGVVAR